MMYMSALDLLRTLRCDEHRTGHSTIEKKGSSSSRASKLSTIVPAVHMYMYIYIHYLVNTSLHVQVYIYTLYMYADVYVHVYTCRHDEECIGNTSHGFRA